MTITLETTRFGAITFEPEDVLTFPQGMAGFESRTEYVLIEHSPDSPYQWLQSAESGDLAFLIVEPTVFFPEYAPEMPSRAAEELELDESTPVVVYTVVTIPRGRPRDMTLNLAGPIVVNVQSRKAKQVILDGDEHPVRRRAFPEAERSAA
jgi:flagellar assembly factor FliW